MSDKSKDEGVIAVLLERFNTQRLPRALALKKKVDGGGLLSDTDIAFLDEVFSDVEHIKPLVDRHPEYNDLVRRAVNLYKEITDKALENEKTAK